MAALGAPVWHVACYSQCYECNTTCFAIFERTRPRCEKSRGI